jgi:hypothetical protein
MALQIAPLIVPEHQILISLYLFMAGTVVFSLLPSMWSSLLAFAWSLLLSIAGLGMATYACHGAGHDRCLSMLVAFTDGFALSCLQFAHMTGSKSNMALPLISREP